MQLHSRLDPISRRVSRTSKRKKGGDLGLLPFDSYTMNGLNVTACETGDGPQTREQADPNRGTHRLPVPEPTRR